MDLLGEWKHSLLECLGRDKNKLLSDVSRCRGVMMGIKGKGHQ